MKESIIKCIINILTIPLIIPCAITSNAESVLLGDINNDGIIDAVDASEILSVYAVSSTGENISLTDEQLKNADVDYNGTVDAVDASSVLSYYAYTSTGGKRVIDVYINDRTSYIKAFNRFSDYSAWAGNIGYSSGVLTASGISGINQDYFKTPVESDAYSSGRIVIGDSRCCQLGIYQLRAELNDFAVFAVWGGHYLSGTSEILSTSHTADVEKCFVNQIKNNGKCEMIIFATVNDYDYNYNNNSTYINAVIKKAEMLSEMSCEVDGIVYHPTVNVIGFEGCWTTGNVFGIPQNVFNRYVSDYNDKLKSAVNSSELLSVNSDRFSTVPDISGGKADFIDDGLHYSDDTLRLICDYIDINF